MQKAFIFTLSVSENERDGKKVKRKGDRQNRTHRE